MSGRKVRSSRIVIDKSNVSSANEDSFSSTLETSRIQEKDQLTHLNSRLATYIDRVRQLEAENNRLQVQIRDIEVVEKKEKNNLADRFEAEKARLRRALDIANDEVSKNKIEYDAARAEVKRLKPQVEKLERELRGAEEQAMHAQSMSDQSLAKQKTLQSRNDKLALDNDDLRKQNGFLRDQVEGLKKAIEDESLLRAAANNKVKSLEEDLAFALEAHRGELEEVRHKRQVDMTTYAKQVNDEYQSKLQDQLAEMRAHFQANLSQNKASFEEAYKNKLNDARERQEAAMDEAMRLRARVRELETSSSGNASLVEKLRAELESLSRMFQDKLEDKDARILELNKEIERMMNEFRDLLDVKIQLDAELRTYQALLEGEEERLNLTEQSNNSMSTHHVSFSTGSGSANRGVKRRRVEVNGEDQGVDYLSTRSKLNKETTGPVGIDEVDENGSWVRIANSIDEEVHIGGYKLVVKAGNKEASFQFNHRMKLSPLASATVYSAESDGKHEPPHTYVMKKQNWPIGENPSARLEDAEGDVVSSITVETVESTDPSDPAERCSIIAISRKIEELSTGSAYCQLTHYLFPDKINLKKIKFNPKSETDILNNWKTLTTSWKEIGIDKPVDVEKLKKGKFQDNFEFFQWFYKFFNANLPNEDNYDPITARNAEPLPALSSRSGAAVRAAPRSSPAAAAPKPKPPAPALGPARRNNANNVVQPQPQVNENVKTESQKEKEYELEKKQLEEIAASLEKERDFYFEKLRAIEDLCTASKNALAPLNLEAVLEILYKNNEDGGESPATTPVQNDDDDELLLVPQRNALPLEEEETF
ncbi:unnamed protein product [Caenorhabditis auriculariae]|uniref:Uncharacterized protein n=1 Tax=Caenorhabditis auriculariae TaxID=2777116 RepID=A0A8S1GR42_9PELO|nr:unnamed protein product [Caenorhabditis auriculariae]